jgi:radical SAM protein with 4Fe4S-binding SPASM domain
MFDPLTWNPKPALLQFETSTACNARCLFCEHSKMKRRGEAKWSTILNVLYNYAHKVQEVCPFGMQEPTLEPRLPAVLSNIRQLNPKAKTTLYTNMSVYNPTVWERIIKYELLDTLAVSYYGFSKQFYEAAQPPLKYAETEKNLNQLLKQRRKLGMPNPQINLHALLTPETIPNAKQFSAKWKGKVDNVGYVHWDSWCGTKPFNDAFETKYWGPPETTRAPCPRLWRTVNIHYDGTFVPCCLDAHEQEPCGNINTNPDDWYTHPNIQRLRRMHLDGEQSNIPLCKNCTVWKREHDPVWNQIWKQTNPALSASNPCTQSK